LASGTVAVVDAKIVVPDDVVVTRDGSDAE
jgi:hypothetical protein